MSVGPHDVPGILRDMTEAEQEEERRDEVRQRLLGPIGQRPAEGSPRIRLGELATKCVVEKAREVVDNIEDHECEHCGHKEQAMVMMSWDLWKELSDIVDDLNTIEEEGWW